MTNSTLAPRPRWRLAIAAGLAIGTSARAGTLFVDDSAPPGGDGLAWGTAFQDLQDALAAASASAGAFDEIWVASGVYRPDRGTNDRAATFQMFSGLTLRGGFAGTESSAEQRVPGLNPTILTGDLGVQGDALDNSFHVVSMRTMFAPCTLDGFVVKHGRADNGSFPNNAGGGFLTEGTTQVINCVFEANHGGTGGGLYSRFGTLTVTGCVFRSNTSSSEGGGLYVRDGGTISSSEFTGNNAAFGGGMACCCGTTAISDCGFYSNFGNFGGGLFNSGATLQLHRSHFIDNSGSRGGAFHSGTNSWIVNCFFGGNSGDRGGALYASASGGSVVNCIFSRNFALSSGGAAWAAAATSFSSCTVHGNNALLFAGGFYLEAGASAVSNSILWSNTDNTGGGQGAQVLRVGGTLTMTSNCVQGWNGTLGGTGNLNASPQFLLPAGLDGIPGTQDDDFRLGPASPCIDAGSSLFITSDSTDLDDDGDFSEPTPLDFGLAIRQLDDHFRTPNAAASMPPVDIGANEFIPPPRVMGDATGDMLVNFMDVTMVLSNWGQGFVPSDMDSSGLVDFGDLTLVLANWGA